MQLQSINPFNNEVIGETPIMDTDQVKSIVDLTSERQVSWSAITVQERAELTIVLGELLRKRKEQLAKIITLEMGKPILEAEAEIEKCAWLCDYYIAYAEEFLKPVEISSDASKSYVQFDPLGVVLGVMPWNFPFWQVFRFAVPTIMAGNTVILKHASNVSMCAAEISRLFSEAGFPNNVFSSIYIPGKRVGEVIENTKVKAVSLTGSEFAGSAVAELAGKLIKPSLLELGGSNAFVVNDDADIALAVDKCAIGRMLNSGQSCIAAKRILVHESIYSEFEKAYIEKVQKLKIGDPLNTETEIGPLAREDLAIDLAKQLKASIDEGCELLLGGNRVGSHFAPTILKVKSADTVVMQEETFGPLAVLMSFSTIDEAISIVNSSKFGLGASIFTANPDTYKHQISKINEGAVFFNEIVKSDPRLPFGGIEKSGYGRELGKPGIRSFVNCKTVYIA